MTPLPEDLAGVAGRTIPDVTAPGLRVLFCGINPGLLSGALGQHFARPGNRFWKVLHEAGFTDRVLSPAEQWELPPLGIGITNLVAGASRGAADLTRTDLRHGAGALEAKVAALRPSYVAVLGMQAYRTAFQRPAAAIGPQLEALGGAFLWLLPNPSGLQASYSTGQMVTMWQELRVAAGLPRRSAEG